MYIERCDRGISYQCIFPLIDYEPSRAAVRTLRWYISHLNRQLDSSRYVFLLTHTECLLAVTIRKGEWRDIHLREMILHRGREEAKRVRENLSMLAGGSIPGKIYGLFSEEVEGIQREWYTKKRKRDQQGDARWEEE